MVRINAEKASLADAKQGIGVGGDGADDAGGDGDGKLGEALRILFLTAAKM